MKKMRRASRRKFLKSATLGTAGTCMSTEVQARPVRARVNDERPNILFINVDQLGAAHTISKLGCPHVTTPHIDRIFENGMSFERAYAADPLCCPARVSWWTGRYSSEHGGVVNNAPCHPGMPHIGLLLANNGYKVFHTGKLHAPGINLREGFHVLHGGTWWGEISDSDVTRSTRAFLQNYKETNPFFFTLGYLNPHDVCLTWDLGLGEEIPHLIAQGILDPKELPPLPTQYEPIKEEPAYLRIARKHQGANTLTELQWRYYLWSYYRQIEMVDREIGLVLDQLEHSPHRNNTLVIFASDHGEGMACHKLVGKTMLYDEGVRVPFVIATLGDTLNIKKNTHNSENLVSGVDLLPTICDYAGTELPENARGLSLKAVVEGEKPESWRVYAYAESSFYARMVCTQGYKYIMEYLPNEKEDFVPPRADTHRMGVEQLFDLDADPAETTNLAYKRAYQDVVEKHRKFLIKQESVLTREKIAHQFGMDEVARIADGIRKADYPITYPLT